MQAVLDVSYGLDVAYDTPHLPPPPICALRY